MMRLVKLEFSTREVVEGEETDIGKTFPNDKIVEPGYAER